MKKKKKKDRKRSSQEREAPYPMSERFIPNRNQRSQPKKELFFYFILFFPFYFFKSNFINFKKKKNRHVNGTRRQTLRNNGLAPVLSRPRQPLTVIFLSASEMNTFT